MQHPHGSARLEQGREQGGGRTEGPATAACAELTGLDSLAGFTPGVKDEDLDCLAEMISMRGEGTGASHADELSIRHTQCNNLTIYVLHCTVLYCTVLCHSIVLNCSVLYCAKVPAILS